jgi:hypothetical protein
LLRSLVLQAVGSRVDHQQEMPEKVHTDDGKLDVLKEKRPLETASLDENSVAFHPSIE